MTEDSKRAIHFPFSQIVRIAILSLRIRWQRSLLVAVSLVLAISFFVYTLEMVGFCRYLSGSAVDFPGKEALFERICPSKASRFGGISSRDLWLITMSLLICLAGITNAQLMAVTERFREIGTFKCLGALDRFIVNLLIVETCIYGFLGGLAGGLLGLVLAGIVLMIRAGISKVISFLISPYTFVAMICLSILVSILLSLLGAIYPTILATRMKPSVALRYEE